jgi:hypothetical protein
MLHYKQCKVADLKQMLMHDSILNVCLHSSLNKDLATNLIHMVTTDFFKIHFSMAFLLMSYFPK